MCVYFSTEQFVLTLLTNIFLILDTKKTAITLDPEIAKRRAERSELIRQIKDGILKKIYLYSHINYILTFYF